jgi:predicted permease
MGPVRRFLLRLVNAVSPGRAERQLAREVDSHLSGIAHDLEQRRGLSADEARLAARKAFGGVEQAKEQQRAERSFRWIDETRQDLAYSARTLARAPGFTFVSVLTLTLGIGASTAIFSVVHGVLLKSLPYHDADRLVRGVWTAPAGAAAPAVAPGAPRPIRSGELTQPEVIDARTRVKSLSAVALTGGPSIMTLSGRGEARRLQGQHISAGLFETLGVSPLLGRLFTAEESGTPSADVIVLSYPTWQRHFQGDAAVVGQTISLAPSLGPPTPPKPFLVIGVMPRGFAFPDTQVQYWLPMSWGPRTRGAMLARVADGVTTETAAAELASLLRATRPDAPAGTVYTLESMQRGLVAPVKPALLVLSGAVAIVLLIACVNVANLLLARTATRQREIAVRIAIGAGRGRIIRQLLTESVVLAVLGGVGGTLVALGGVRVLRSLATTFGRMDLGVDLQFPRLDEIAVDPTVLAFALAVSVGVGVLFGLAPALRHSRPSQMDALRESAGATPAAGAPGSHGLARWRSVLVVVQVVAALVLLVGGGLLMHSFLRLTRVDMGYDAGNVLTFQVALPSERYPVARLAPFADAIVEKLRAVPSVRAAAYAQQLPTVALRDSMTFTRLRDGHVAALSSRRPPDRRLVSRGYLEAIGVRVLAGRGFRESDRAGAPPVMLINDVLARREFPGENPVGQFVGMPDGPWEIVGVVDSVRQFGPELEPDPQFFADFRQWPEARIFPLGPYYVVRTDGDPLAIVPIVRSAARQLEAEAGLYNVATLEQLIGNRVARPRLYAVLLGIFAAVAFALAVVGLYGVMAYGVTERTREIGIRMALGAQRRDVLRLVLGQSLAVVCVGIALGLGGAALLTRFLQGLLFGITPLDATTFVAVAAVFAGTAALAAYVPARRAAAIDPLLAIRDE